MIDNGTMSGNAVTPPHYPVDPVDPVEHQVDEGVDFELQAFDPEFIANKEAEMMAALLGTGDDNDDPLTLHPFGGDL